MKKSDRRQAESDFFDTAENVPNFSTSLKFAGASYGQLCWHRVNHQTATDRHKLVRWLSKRD